jgi:hypothetical protein
MAEGYLCLDALSGRMMEKWFDFNPDNLIMTVAAAMVLSGVSVGADTELLIERMRPLGRPGGCE